MDSFDHEALEDLYLMVTNDIKLLNCHLKTRFAFIPGQLNDTQQELKENNELVVELQGKLG